MATIKGKNMQKKFLVIAFLFIIVGQSSAMQSMAFRTAFQTVKPFIKKGFSGTMTALHWAIAAGGSMNQGWKKIKALSDEKKTLATEGYINAQDDVSNFIIATLK